MSLKDHITDSTKLKEEEIEAIIADNLKYDPDHSTVVFLPKTQTLSVEKRILLYMVALRGWRFVVEEKPPNSDASPAEIEKATGLRGGTIRPILRAMVQSRILASHKGRYELPAHNMGRVREAINNERGLSIHRNESVGHKKSPGSFDDRKKAGRKTTGSKVSLAIGFRSLLDSGWFEEGKTLLKLKDKLDQMTIIVPKSQLPFYLLKAIRDGKLHRIKELVNGKSVWLYSSNSDTKQ